jgi:hypothetical protein
VPNNDNLFLYLVRNINDRNLDKKAYDVVRNNLSYEEIILTPPKPIEEKIYKSKFKRSAKTAKELIKIDKFKTHEHELVVDADVGNLVENQSDIDSNNQTVTVKIRWRYRIFRIGIKEVIRIHLLKISYNKKTNI